ncbi:peptidoglycan editing factor PgeF [Marinobacter sp. V034]|uniref:peptidoglycan editing factor PgeF n=1 Tax=Marinobacter sp. V034 TaxID=3459610 RepID=UPI00404497EC
MLPLLQAEWPAHPRVRTAITTRSGGSSVAPYDSFNLGDHVGDADSAVSANRALLAEALALPARAFGWVSQVHGCDVASLPGQSGITADASVTRQAGSVCSILTADCLPVLFSDLSGEQVAAAHAGWRGLAGGVLEQTLAQFANSQDVIAWLGPAIGPAAFEVGPEVRQAFVDIDPGLDAAFVASSLNPDHYFADLYQLARMRLSAAGIAGVYGGGECTYSDRQRFYSYRRDGQTGRMASLIWLG